MNFHKFGKGSTRCKVGALEAVGLLDKKDTHKGFSIFPSAPTVRSASDA